MKTEVQTETTVHLVLSELEAQWLRSYVQNYQGPTEEESDENREMRKAFFDALVGVPY